MMKEDRKKGKERDGKKLKGDGVWGSAKVKKGKMKEERKEKE